MPESDQQGAHHSTSALNDTGPGLNLPSHCRVILVIQSMTIVRSGHGEFRNVQRPECRVASNRLPKSTLGLRLLPLRNAKYALEQTEGSAW